MLLLKTPTIELKSSGRLVKAADLATIAQATHILEAAHQEADSIRASAQQAFEKEKARGHEEGLNEGREEIAIQKLDMLESSVQYLEGMEEKMVDIVMMALRKCVEEIGDQEMVIQIVRKAMAAIIRNQQHITIKVAPAMVPVVRQRLNEILANFSSVNAADVMEDPRLENQACILETEAGIVEANISTQLAAIEKSMRKQFDKGQSKD